MAQCAIAPRGVRSPAGRHPASLARSWAAVLDGYRVVPYDEEELCWLRKKGIDDPEDDPRCWRRLAPGWPRYFFVLEPAGKVAQNRVQLDLGADNPAAEVARLVCLGAGVRGLGQRADPEGNEFCVLR